MGPIVDKLGVEQGGVNSDKIYKLCNNVKLSTAQKSGLSDPLLVLQSPPFYSHWKNLTKCKVLEWWLHRYRAIAHHMSSLEFFNPSFMSLSKPHPI